MNVLTTPTVKPLHPPVRSSARCEVHSGPTLVAAHTDDYSTVSEDASLNQSFLMGFGHPQFLGVTAQGWVRVL